MAKNKLSDLRDHLFGVLEDLNDPEKDLDQTIKRARAMRDISGEIINTAKVEVEMVKAISNSALDPSAFFDGTNDRLLPAAEPEKKQEGGSGLRPPLRIAEGRRR